MTDEEHLREALMTWKDKMHISLEEAKHASYMVRSIEKKLDIETTNIVGEK